MKYDSPYDVGDYVTTLDHRRSGTVMDVFTNGELMILWDDENICRLVSEREVTPPTYLTVFRAPKQRRSLLRTVAFAVAAGVVTVSALWLATPAKAAGLVTSSGPSDAMCIASRHQAVTHHPEVNTVRTDCIRHGWIVRPRIVVGPHDHVRFNTMPRCINEDGSYLKPGFDHWVGPRSVGLQRHCFWNAHERGNGRGTSYFLDHVHGGSRITWVIAKGDRS